jgi:hypothetical protein
MARLLRIAICIACLLSARSTFAAGGACPASSPVAGNSTCFFIAANGSDTNDGASESTPWMHAPGMPNCASACLTEQNALGGSPGNGGNSHPGIGFIFRGGDTWHFGNPGASPYTGGTFYNAWGGGPACQYEGATNGCFYIGVDSTWWNSSVCGSSWCRPIFNGDNPTSTSHVASCAYQTGNTWNRGDTNNRIMVETNDIQSWVWVDGFEFIGLCTNRLTNAGNSGTDVYLLSTGPASGTYATKPMIFKTNLYFHGWTETTNAAANAKNSDGQPAMACAILGGGNHEAMWQVVVDGSDSVPGDCAADTFPSIYHWKDNIFRYTTQIVAAPCHDIHDNIFEHFYNPTQPTHGNLLECNNDGNTGPAEVMYNNIIRHQDPSFPAGGQVLIWRCPNSTPEYWFNNLIYDAGGAWDYAGPPNYPGCPLTGGQWMFNNTLVDIRQPCYVPLIAGGGSHLTVYNEHLINSSGNWFDGSGSSGQCNGGPSSATNVTMTDATATKQGYTTGSSGTVGNGNTCANDTTTPCAPTAVSKGTVGTGTNFQSYCAAMAAMTSDTSISVDAANACQYGTTDACVYVKSTHTMNCPAQTAVARPKSTAWDPGAYQFSGAQAQAPQPPTNLQATVSQ